MTGQSSPIVRVAVEHLPASTAAVPAARAATVCVLRAWALNEACVETAELVVSELTTNAAKASSSADVIAVRLTAGGASLVVEVWDGNDTPPTFQDLDVDAEGGRGLFLVDALSTRWAWYPVKSSSGGKVVWSLIRAEWQRAAESATDAGPHVPLPRRTPGCGPDAAFPITFIDDPALLQQVIDRLRALDDWHLSPVNGRAGRIARPMYRLTMIDVR